MAKPIEDGRNNKESHRHSAHNQYQRTGSISDRVKQITQSVSLLICVRLELKPTITSPLCCCCQVVVIANALDDAPPEVRRAGSSWSCRHWLTLASTLSSSTWRLLRPARPGCAVATCSCAATRLYHSGADAMFRGAACRGRAGLCPIQRGPCVLSPSLRGLELVDDPGAV